MSVVTRIAYSHRINAGKLAQLHEQARRLGRVRSKVWQGYGSIAGVGQRDRDIRDGWLEDGTAKTFGVLTNPWKETLRDAVGDITANRESAKVKVRRAIHALPVADVEKKRLYTLLKADKWTDDPYLRRQMRKHCQRGKNRTHNQIIVRSDNYTTRVEHGRCWLAVPGLVKGRRVIIPLNTTHQPTGTLRLILRGGKVEVHYQVNEAELASTARPTGTRAVGVDKGYSEVFVDSDGDRHGEGFGALLSAESDHRSIKGKRRAKIRFVAEKAVKAGNPAKADRIYRNNLGTKKRHHRTRRFESRAKTLIYESIHAVVDKANVVVSEDLTAVIKGKRRSRRMNRRLAAWTKGTIARAVEDVTRRRGSSSRQVNASYTSQLDPRNGTFARRSNGKVYCFDGVVYDDDHAAALNVLARLDDDQIGRYTPYREVRRIVQERTERHRLGTAQPGL